MESGAGCPISTHIVVLDKGVDESQARFQGWKYVSRFLGDVQQHLCGIDEPLFLGCGVVSGLERAERMTGFLTRTRLGWCPATPFPKDVGHSGNVVGETG